MEDIDKKILDIFLQINGSKEISLLNIEKMEKTIEDKFETIKIDNSSTDSIIYERYIFLLTSIKEKLNSKKEILVRDLLKKNYKQNLIKYLESVKENKSNSIIFVFSGTSRIQEIKSYRTSYFVKEFISRGIPTIYSTWKWTDNSDFQKDYMDGILFETPIDKTLEYILEIIRYNFNLDNKIFIISFPYPEISKYIEILKFYGWTVIYDIMDDWEEFQKVKQANWYKKNHEIYIVEKSDIVMAVSNMLIDKFKKNIYLMPNALDNKIFNYQLKSYSEFLEIKTEENNNNFKIFLNNVFSKKINLMNKNEKEIIDKVYLNNKIGYVGHLTKSWFDWKSLIEIAKRLPQYKFEIIGHSIDFNIRKLPSNIVYLGAKQIDDIVEISRDWTVGIIPFKMGALSDGVDPLKVYEYLAMGLNVVSFRMPQIDKYPNVITTNSVEEFIEAIEISMKKTFDYRAALEFLKVNTWAYRVDTLFEIIKHKDGELV